MTFREENQNLTNLVAVRQLDDLTLNDFKRETVAIQTIRDHFNFQKQTIFQNSALKNGTMEALNQTNPISLKTRKFLNGYSKIHELKLVSIGLASSGKIQQWAEKVLPNGKILGEVTNANTLHYKTFKPTKGGLFCERIFGPLKDFECSCGIRKRPSIEESEKILDHLETPRRFCEICDVEYTWSVIRRYQLGYIHLTSPVSHLWYLKSNPSYLSILLDVKRKKLESIIYCTETTTLENVWKSIHTYGFENSPSFIYLSWKNILKQEQKSKGKQSTNLLKSTNELQTQNLKKKRISPIRFKNWCIPNLKSVESKFAPNIIKSPNLISSFTRDLAFHPHICGMLEMKRYQQFQRFLIPGLWKTSWQKLLTRVYLKSLKQNSYIWKSFWTRYFKKNDKILLQKTMAKEMHTFSNMQYLNFILKQEMMNPPFSKAKPSIPTAKNERGNLRNLNWNSEFPRLVRVNANRFNQIHPSLTKEPILNPFLIEARLDPYLKTLAKTKFAMEPSGFDGKANSVLKVPVSKPTLNAQVFQKRKKMGSMFQNYALFSFFHYFQKNQKLSKLFQIWIQISNSQIRRNLISKLSTQFLTSFSQLEKGISFYFTRHQIRHQSTLLIQIRKLSFLCLQRVLRASNRSNTRFVTFENSIIKNSLKLFKILKIENAFKMPKTESPNANLKPFLFTTKDLTVNAEKFEFKFEPHSRIAIYRPTLRLSSQKSKFYLQKEKFKWSQSALNNPIYGSSNGGFYLKTLKPQTPSKLMNNLYCISHFYTWDLDRDWKYFFYYTSGPSNFMDLQIPHYKHRTFNLSELNFSSTITGAALIQRLLVEFHPTELKKISKQHQILLPKLRKKIRQLKSNPGKGPKTHLSEIEKLLKKRDHIMRRLKVLRQLLRKNTDPGSMILSKLPVLPPDLRPILKLEDQIAASDLNTLYQRIIFRNDRLKKFLKDPAISQSFESKYAQRLLQEAVDNLIQNGKGNVKPETNSRGQPLKSLSEILKGKQGRFRQYLLGKRVDYSGRSVIVVGPKLNLHQCGLPKEMALELFLPFLIKRILHYKLAATIIGAKTLIKSQKEIVWELLREVMQNHPVLLNRAPTLHRLGIQAFQPKLVEGRAILIHPLVCPAFNADFDGDQMAVHVPLTVEARIESWKLMFSRNNLISPATGEPIVLPSQDMVLGCYYLTTEKYKFQRIQKRKLKKSTSKKHNLYALNSSNFLSTEFMPTNFRFTNLNQVLQAYQLNHIASHASIWLKWNGLIESKLSLSEPIELQVDRQGYLEEVRMNLYRRFNSNLVCLDQFMRTTPGRVFFNHLIQNYLNS